MFSKDGLQAEARGQEARGPTGILTADRVAPRPGVIANAWHGSLSSSSCQTSSTLSTTFTLKTWTKSHSEQATALRLSKRTTISEMAGGRSVLEALPFLMPWLKYLFKQGRNLQGHTGLFPQAYTAPAPPVGSAAPHDSPLQNGKSALHPLDEESETESAAHPQEHSSATIHAPIPKSPAILQQNGDHSRSTAEFSSYSATTMSSTVQHRRIGSGSDGEVMKATLTDVQQAIEQLGRPDHEVAEDSDRERSFSFASSRDGDGGETETETDYENSDIDIADVGGEGYHVGARRKLAMSVAETARRAMEEADKLNAITNSMPSARRMVSPPINVEMSDESDDEDYTRRSESYRRAYPHIPEEDEEEARGTAAEKDSSAIAVSAAHSTATTVTSTPLDNPVNSDTPTASAIRSEEAQAKPASSAGSNSATSAPSSNKRSSTSDTRASDPRRASSPRSNGYVMVSSLDGVVRSVSPQPQGQEMQMHPPLGNLLLEQGEKEGVEKKEKSPTEWTLDDVLEWLKSKGFDEDVQSKFLGAFSFFFLLCVCSVRRSLRRSEQEITGDVLLELDANLLKTEIGIMAFGKRVRIANAIVELRGQLSSSPSSFHGQGQLFQQSPETSPPSFPGSTSYHPASTPPHMLHGATSYSPLGGHYMPGLSIGGQPPAHSRTYSASQNSQRSIPGSTSMPPMQVFYPQGVPGGGMQPSTSLPSPLAPTFASGWSGVPGLGSNPGAVNGHRVGPESVAGSVLSREDNQDKDKDGVGLGLMVHEQERVRRPAHLSLSPSDGALSDQVHAVNGDEDGAGIEEEERGHLSEVRSFFPLALDPDSNFLLICRRTWV